MLLYIQIALGILLLFYFFVAFFSGRTWKLVHVFLVLLIFFGSAVFLVMTTMTLKTHQQWRQLYNKKKAALIKVQQENALLENGIVKTVEGEIERLDESVHSVNAEMSRELYDRGRIYRNGMPGVFDETTRQIQVDVVTLEAPKKLYEKPPALKPLRTRMIIHAFKESVFEKDGLKRHRFNEEIDKKEDYLWLPTIYMGEFEITAVTAATAEVDRGSEKWYVETSRVTLRPTLPLDSIQLAHLQTRDRTWVLYELMPVDSHVAFQDLERATLESLMPSAKMHLGEDADSRYKALIDQYLRDFKKPANISATDRIWKKVKFIKPYSIEIDAGTTAKVLDPETFDYRYFDSAGHAEPASLRQGEYQVEEKAFLAEPTEFEVGDEALFRTDEDGNVLVFHPETVDEMVVFPREKADDLIAKGICKEVESVFVRRLNDYAFQFRELSERMAWLQDARRVVQRDMITLKGSSTGSVVQLDYRKVEDSKMKEDIDRLKAERDHLTAYLAMLQKQWTGIRTDMSRLYRENNLLAAELKKIQDVLNHYMDQRIRAVSTDSSPR